MAGDLALHHAVMGCLVEDENGKLFGLTCEHVTRAANGIFLAENELGELEQVGRALQLRKEKIFDHDIDIIELDGAQQTRLNAEYKDRGGDIIHSRVFDGDIRSLYGRDVFHFFFADQENLNTAKRGSVCDAETHEKHSNLINLTDNFLVQGHGSAFAKEGDSGRVVAINTESRCVELIGIIVAGKFDSKYTDISEGFSLCLLLNNGLGALSKFYNKKLRLHEKFPYGSALTMKYFESAGIIWFKTPEQIKLPDFDLCEQLEMLCACFSIEENNDEVQILINFEIKMSNKVFSREDVTSDEYSFDQADQNCVFHSMLACQYLYEKRFKETENHLKIACRMVSSKSRFPTRLLCKVITYVTWMLLDMNKLDEMKLLLDAGLEFMEDTKHCKCFPTESIGYQYYDYARYHQRKQQVQKAARMAKRCVHYFMQEKRTDTGSPNRIILAVSLFASIKLGCGEEFETYKQEISDTDLEEAEFYLTQVNDIANDQPSVQITDYLLASCDLKFRKGKTTEAIHAAKTCLKIAKDAQLMDEIKWSRKRLKKLCALNKTSNLTLCHL